MPSTWNDGIVEQWNNEYGSGKDDLYDSIIPLNPLLQHSIIPLLQLRSQFQMGSPYICPTDCP
jgi:hypothetical protein